MSVKTHVIVFVAVLFAVFGCASVGAKATKPAQDGGAMMLDMALAQASALIDKDLGAERKIAMVNFNSPSDRFSSYVLDELAANLLETKKLIVVDRNELDLVRKEFNFQYSGEVDERTMQELGKMFGAQSIVSGSLTEIGEGMFRIVIKALNVQTAAVAVQYRANIVGDNLVYALLRGGKLGATAATATTKTTITETSSGDKQSAQTVAPKQTAGAKQGTYTFYPRPRATNAGLPINCYLHKIEVKEKYLIVYQSGDAKIAKDRGAPGYWYINYNVILTDLDNPAKTWQPINHQDDVGGTGYEAISFENVSATRFSLECSWSGQNIYDEIILGEPDE
jgi:TolB-like protein